MAKSEDDYLCVYMSTSGEDHVLPAWSNGAGRFQFIIPADYENPWADKLIDDFWLTDGEMACEITGLTHKALEANPLALAFLAMDGDRISTIDN